MSAAFDITERPVVGFIATLPPLTVGYQYVSAAVALAELRSTSVFVELSLHMFWNLAVGIAGSFFLGWMFVREMAFVWGRLSDYQKSKST
jgi:hypothetical protein